MPQARVLVHTSVQSLRWGDMDALGHVNNTVYFRYMEQARIEWLYRLASAEGAYTGASGPVIVNASCTFVDALKYPGDVHVLMSLDAAGRTSIDSHYLLQRDGATVAEGEARIVWIDMATRRPVPLPAAVIAQLSPGAS